MQFALTSISWRPWRLRFFSPIYFCDGYFSYEKSLTILVGDTPKEARKNVDLWRRRRDRNKCSRSLSKDTNAPFANRKGRCTDYEGSIFSASTATMVLDLEPCSLNEQSHPALPHTPPSIYVRTQSHTLCSWCSRTWPIISPIEKNRKQYIMADQPQKLSYTILVLELIFAKEQWKRPHEEIEVERTRISYIRAKLQAWYRRVKGLSVVYLSPVMFSLEAIICTLIMTYIMAGLLFLECFVLTLYWRFLLFYWGACRFRKTFCWERDARQGGRANRWGREW